MAKKRKNNNYVTDKVIARRKAEEMAAVRKEKGKKIATTVTVAILVIALIAGVIAMGFGLGWWEHKYEATHHASIEIEGYGTVHLELYGKEAPETVQNFVDLANAGYYNGSTFHRIMKDFMAQGGAGDNTAASIRGEFKENGFNNPIKHKRGVISMARANDPDSASSQFFIVHQTSEDNSSALDGKYAAFGMVTSGMEFIDAICEAADPNAYNGMLEESDQPIIKSITIHKSH